MGFNGRLAGHWFRGSRLHFGLYYSNLGTIKSSEYEDFFFDFCCTLCLKKGLQNAKTFVSLFTIFRFVKWTHRGTCLRSRKYSIHQKKELWHLEWKKKKKIPKGDFLSFRLVNYYHQCFSLILEGEQHLAKQRLLVLINYYKSCDGVADNITASFFVARLVISPPPW